MSTGSLRNPHNNPHKIRPIWGASRSHQFWRIQLDLDDVRSNPLKYCNYLITLIPDFCTPLNPLFGFIQFYTWGCKITYQPVVYSSNTPNKMVRKTTYSYKRGVKQCKIRNMVTIGISLPLYIYIYVCIPKMVTIVAHVKLRICIMYRTPNSGIVTPIETHV